MTTRCARCNRPLRHPVEVAGMVMGSTCAQAVVGAKPKRRRRIVAEPVVDPRQADLFVVEVAA